MNADDGERSGRVSLLEKALAAGVVIGAFATVPLILVPERADVPAWAVQADGIIWSIFLTEYSAKIIRGRFSTEAFKSTWLDLFVVVLSFPYLPALVSAVRLVRLESPIRLLRLSGLAYRIPSALSQIPDRSGVVHVACIALFLVLAGGGGGVDMARVGFVRRGLAGGKWLEMR